jgi:hypothetical protein
MEHLFLFFSGARCDHESPAGPPSNLKRTDDDEIPVRARMLETITKESVREPLDMNAIRLVPALLLTVGVGLVAAQNPSLPPLPAPIVPALPPTLSAPPAHLAAPPAGDNKAAAPEEKPADAKNGDAKNGDAKNDDKKDEKKNDNPCWCNPGEAFDLGKWLFGKESKCDFQVWSNFGYHSSSDGYWNDQPGKLNLHQLGFALEKAADGKDGWDWGGRISFIYGIDGVNTQAFGNNPGTWDFQNGWGSGVREGWALPELYGTLAYQDWTFKVGHFYTLIGYDVVPSTGNFFYSHSFTFNFSEPFTHTGALASYKFNDQLNATAGFVLGNDTGYYRFRSGFAFIGQVLYNPSEKLNTDFVVNFGDLGATGNGVHTTILITYKPDDKWEYAVQNDICKHDGFDGVSTYNSVGLLGAAYYKFNDCVRAGGRAEVFNVNSHCFYNVTAGVNYTPQANMRIRPELRYQWGEENDRNPGIAVDRFIFGIDMVLSF